MTTRAFRGSRCTPGDHGAFAEALRPGRFSYTARLEHVGRRSGRPYATPVVTRRVPGGFAIPLPYGRDVDWLRNLEAGGHAVLVVGGQRHAVTAPRVVPFDGLVADLPWAGRAIDRFLIKGDWLRVTATDDTATDDTDPARRSARR